eukprot:CAMPEP_0177664806 /NCGR_PEP_ID=MMETSP0447-20121125/20708_1 /TAXON_ID=0 /ORGANISM="Stygamoeba regulata, Strain BSH-02190019" /LENGTH=183 /DNA_ID=CAMNT_0019170839 /DNA_START=136 /DNA_END=687 /DNA_ORIENTATION=+
MTDVDVQLTLDPEEEMDDVEEEEVSSSRVKSSVRVTRDEGKKTKGRGIDDRMDVERESRYSGKGGRFDGVDRESRPSRDGPGPQRSIEGYIVFITNVHEEAQEEELLEVFREFGDIKNMHMPLDRRTGFVKGYAMVEYEQFEEAQKAITEMNGKPFMSKKLGVDWTFWTAPQRRTARQPYRPR